MADLDPYAAERLAVAMAMTPIQEVPLEQARERMRAALVRDEPLGVPQVSDVWITGGDVPVGGRIYHPEPGTKLPVLIFFHGGGWVFNDLDTHDHLCSTLAVSARCVVLAVDYRRSPEHKYPAALGDAQAALSWARQHATSFGGNPQRVAVGGDSAGGALAAGLAKVDRDQGSRGLFGLLLFYPVLEHASRGPASYDERGPGFPVDRTFMEWIWGAYLPEVWDIDDPYLFPLRGDLSGLPEVVLYIAEYDVLRDEGVAFAQALAQSGVPVTFCNAEDQMHGYANHTVLNPRARAIVERAARRMGDLARPSGM